MSKRFVLLIAALVLLTACDGYIEEARVQRDGSVEFVVQARVDCSDPLQQEIWGGDPCDAIDDAIRTGQIGDLPLGVSIDPNRVSIVGSGEADRRTIDVTWNGNVSEVSSLLVTSGSVRELDDLRTEATFEPSDSPLEALNSSADEGIIEQLRVSRWEPATFRITTPDLVIEHNGDDIQGRVVIWELDDDRPDQFRVVWTTEDPQRRWWWWAIVSTSLMVILLMMVALEGSPKTKPND
ncbi:MAG: hypothetical protein ACI81L_003305 [Verrucomicrobiales bacterium]|jgi:hypothetical protein